MILSGTRGKCGLLATVDIQRGEVSGDASHGFEIGNAGRVHRLTVRGATFDGSAIHITDLVTTVDLGTMLDPGGNTMNAIPAGFAAVAFTQALSEVAVVRIVQGWLPRRAVPGVIGIALHPGRMWTWLNDREGPNSGLLWGLRDRL